MSATIDDVLAALDVDAAMERVLRLMAIPGRSGQEAAVADAVKSILREAGVADAAISHDLTQRKSPIGGEIGNLIVKLPGTMRAPRRLLMAHLDTVPLCVGCEPYIDGDLIRNKKPGKGLGGDNRGGTAAVLAAVVTLLKNKIPHPPLTILLTVQEEIGLRGVRNVNLRKLGNPQLCFNWDGRDAHGIIIAATGDIAIEVDIFGVPSHAGARPEYGVSAAAIAALAISDLVENGYHGLIEKGRRKGTGNVGVVSGGEATNVVMPELRLRAEVRSHDPAFRAKLVDVYRKAFEKAAKKLKSVDGKRGRVEFRWDLKYDSFSLPPDQPCILAAESAVRAIDLEPQRVVANGGLDANWLSALGLPTVTLGCGQHDIHTADETLHIPTYLNACRIAALLASGVV